MNTEEHNLALIREWAMQKAMSYNRGKNVPLDDIIADAKKIANWYENNPSATIISLVKDGE